MISSGVLCTISVFVSNLCCLALFSFFSSILPSKRNLLTQLNTVLVFVLTAMVNVMVRWNKMYSGRKSSFEKSQNPLLDVIFSSVAPAWSRPHANSQLLWQWFFSWFCFGFRRFCKEFLSHSASQGCSWSSRWTKSKKRIHLIGLSRQSSTSWTMRGGLSLFSFAFWLETQSSLLLLWASTICLQKVKVKIQKTNIVFFIIIIWSICSR